ncbi:MAG: regulatory protein RecX [Clostridia bacterium]|nr:regulatory protein RecX [Clostridia bacterium]
MQITCITPADGQGKRQIYIDDELFAALPSDVVMSLDLHTGDELNEQQAEDLIVRVESLRALQKAYDYLSYNALSRKKLGEKLIRADFSGDAVERALERLEQLGLVDDKALGERLVSVMQHSKHWGYRRAREELYKRGIAGETADEVLSEYDSMPALYWQLEHKYRKYDLSDIAVRKKVMAGLVRLGFSFDEIRSALRDFEDEE